MLDEVSAINIATEHLATIHPRSVDIMCLDFASYSDAKPSELSPGPNDRSGWRVYFRYTNGIEGHYIVCVDAETGEIYFVFAM